MTFQTIQVMLLVKDILRFKYHIKNLFDLYDIHMVLTDTLKQTYMVNTQKSF